MKNSGFEESKEESKRPQSAALIPLEIGPTTTCRVYKTRILGKWLFVKELKPELRHDPRLEAAFLKEMEIGFQLDHPGLPRYVLTEGWLPEGRYVAMEYIDGLTLEEFLKKNPRYFAERRNLIRFITEMADVLDYLHSHQVMHLDIKPSNVMITRIGENVKLIDLGFCQTDTFQDTAGHTPGYLAPERKEDGDKTEATDYYGLGLLLRDIRRDTEGYPERSFRKLEDALLHKVAKERPASREAVEKMLPKKSVSVLPLIVAALMLVLVAAFFIFRQTGNPEYSDTPAATETEDTSGVMAAIPEVPDSAKDENHTLQEESEAKNSELPEPPGFSGNQENDIAAREPSMASGNSHSDFIGKTEPKTSDDPSPNTSQEAALLAKMTGEIRTEITAAYTPASERLMKAIKEGNYTEQEHSAIDKLLETSISMGSLYQKYVARYPSLSKDQIADIVAEEMEETQKRLWLGEWQKYKLEYQRRVRTGTNNSNSN